MNTVPHMQLQVSRTLDEHPPPCCDQDAVPSRAFCTPYSPLSEDDILLVILHVDMIILFSF